MKRSLLLVVAALMLLSCRQEVAPNPVIPMTAITGRPQRADVERLLCQYHDVGIEQFLIYPRSGLEIEYMSDEWMRFCRNCLEVADSLGMKVWLYDEYNWPSGSCKGAVTAGGHEDCYPKVLMFDNDGTGTYTTRVATNAIGADILNPEAVSRFIALTHERYYEEFADYFGRVIPAVFTDEPSFCYSMNAPSGMLEANFTHFDNDHFALTWYPGLEEEYAAACGRDLHEDVVAYLHGEPSGELWTNYYNLVGDRMRGTYLQTLSDWCDAHSIKLSGHLMYEKLYKGVRCNGNALKALSLFGIPGFDEANSDIALSAREMEISGLSLVQYAGQGRKGGMCELYSVGPADNPVSIMRQLMWMCASFGIDNYVVAVAAMDARGNREKGDWYFPSGPTQPWFDYYREFTAEAARAANFARKSFTPQVLVRVPSSYFMSLDKTPAFEAQGLRYLRFLENLLAWQLQYRLLDEDEDAGALPVLTFGPDGFGIEGEEMHFDELEPYFDHISRAVRRRLVVYDDCGAEVRDVLVRSWDDGTFTLVDLTDNDSLDRLLTVRSGLRSAVVRLQGHGAFAGSFRDARRTSILRNASAPDMDGAVMTPRSTNLVRCTFVRWNPQFAFHADGDVDGLRLHLRSALSPVRVLLDGREMEAEETSERLPEGFWPLYRQTEAFSLAAGEHVISVLPAEGGDATAVDYRYLPAVWIEGPFMYSRESRSMAAGESIRSTVSSEGLPDYVGTYDIVKEIDGLPEVLAFNTNLACTEVLVDGISLGRRAWGPYEWDVPESMREGLHTLTVRISTSIMPMFGDLSLLDADQPYISWLRIKPGMHGNKAVTGIF